MNKITQSINKIFHCTEKADADISMCEENNVDSPSKKSKPKITLLQRRLLWCLIGIALLTGGYFWWKMPARMRVIAVIPIEHDYYTKTEYTPLGLYCWYRPANRNEISTLTLYGWDGKVCWSRQLTENSDDVSMTCSTDGHYAAVRIKVKNTVKVLTWHDGNFIGEASFIEKRKIYSEFYVDNFGRVWLYYQNLMESYIIKAIDGTHIASGSIPITFIDSGLDDVIVGDLHFYVNQDIIGEYQKASFQYWKLKVEDDKVFAEYTKIFKNYSYWFDGSGLIKDKNKNIYNINRKILYYSDSYCNSFIIPGTNGNVLTLKYDLGKENRYEYSFIYLPTKQQWNIPCQQYIAIDPLCGTPDGKHILSSNFEISNILELISNFLLKFIELDYYFSRINSEIVLYNNNEKEAVFPIKWIDNRDGGLASFIYSGRIYYMDWDFALSPDGQRVATTCFSFKNGDNKSFYIILGR